MSTIQEVEKVVYTAKIHTTGGRDGGTAQSNDDRLSIKLAIPGSRGRHQSGAALRCRVVGLLRRNPGNCRPKVESFCATRNRDRFRSGPLRKRFVLFLACSLVRNSAGRSA